MVRHRSPSGVDAGRGTWDEGGLSGSRAAAAPLPTRGTGMKPIRLPLSGSCRCGRVEIRIRKPPLATSACHCRGCQKMSSSAYSLTAIIPADGFEITKGEPVIGGLHGPDLHHYFCGHCMTWMFTRPEGMDWSVNVRPNLFDDVSRFRPLYRNLCLDKTAVRGDGRRQKFRDLPGTAPVRRVDAGLCAMGRLSGPPAALLILAVTGAAPFGAGPASPSPRPCCAPPWARASARSRCSRRCPRG
jgi:hypothetical protein